MTTYSEIDKQIRELQQYRDQLERDTRKEQGEKLQAIKDDPSNWEWHVAPADYRDFHSRKLVKGLRVSKRLRPEVLEEWKKGGPATFSDDAVEGRWLGMFYYRTAERILDSNGGGHVVLPIPRFCSDAQWEALSKGMVMDELLAPIQPLETMEE